MRLTLRTLLAWLDGVFAEGEQRSLGDRVAGSTVATGLTQRILVSVGRGDLDAPRVDSWGTPDDANFVADYLENRLNHDQLEWFERICLQSEPRLAEVADCHGAMVELGKLERSGDVVAAANDSTRDRLKRIVHQTVSRRAAGATAPSAVATPVLASRTHGVSAADPARHDDRPVTRAAAAAALRPSAAVPRRPAIGQKVVSPDGHGSFAAPTDPAAAPRRGKRLLSKLKRQSSDRFATTAAVGLMLALGAGAVAWLNFGGRAGDPRRAAVQGFVTFDGAPLETGVVVMLPAGDTKGPTAGSAVSNGSFSIAAASGPVTGRYRIEIKALRKTGRQVKTVVSVGGRQVREASEQFIPAKYNKDSELEIEIKPGRNKISLELKSEPKPAGKPGAQSKPPRIVAGRDRLPGNAAPGGRPG